MHQSIQPDRRLFFAGDTVEFTLQLDREEQGGRALLRTNLGSVIRHRDELIDRTEKGRATASLDWRDYPMVPAGDGLYRLTLPLTEVGVFEAKCCYAPGGDAPMLWPKGENLRFKVSPASSIAGNGIYCAFVRQFGANCELARSPAPPEGLKKLDDDGYTVIPPSGTFRNVIARLDHIFGELGCRILQLLPIHPAPTQFGRMGRYGSPFAATDYFNVDPALADFDRAATPMEQFIELVDAVHSRCGRIFMDIPVNHTGWASKLQTEHPEYFIRENGGTFRSPGAWGVVWEDLCSLDYRNVKVHEMMAKVFLFWCSKGVDGFRCDAGYMVPENAWNYIIAKVRREYPDTIFLLEGLGGPLAVQEKLLGGSGLDWGYSELFQCYDRSAIETHYPYMAEVSRQYGTLVNFAETHDNTRLAAGGRRYAKLRFLTAALLANGGAFGFANGAEFFATERIDVHGSGALNFGGTPNLNALIRKLNRLLDASPAFAPGSSVELIQRGGGNVVAARRRTPEGEVAALVLLNFDCEHPATVRWAAAATPAEGRDLLNGGTFRFQPEGGDLTAQLAPGDGFCIGFGKERALSATGSAAAEEPQRSRRQRAASMARHIAAALGGLEAAARSGLAEAMLEDPAAFVGSLAGAEAVPPIVRWRFPADSRRRVMAAPGDILLLEAESHFRFHIYEGDRCRGSGMSLRSSGGRHFALFATTAPEGEHPVTLRLRASAYPDSGKTEHAEGELLLLPAPGRRYPRFHAEPYMADPLRYAFGSNDLGGYTLARSEWGKIASKYEALLAANPSPDFPADRRILFTRCRAFLVVDEYSNEIGLTSVRAFTGRPNNCARWVFSIPAGQGCLATLEAELSLALNADAIRIRFRRPRGAGGADELPAAKTARLILRPDVEDRVNHELTRAYTGPERRFPASVRSRERGFSFAPGDLSLELSVDRGKFHSEPEWHYQVPLPFESRYGLGDRTDLFSPGYFTIDLAGGEEVTLSAQVIRRGRAVSGEKTRWPAEQHGDAPFPSAEECLEASIRRFIVRRDGFNSVIAGYPWFLDWGRDTLIALRGIIRSPGFRRQAEGILLRFARYEEGGTIPNIIHGDRVGNRDTSDAPLYLLLAAKEFCAAAGSDELLERDCGGRTLREVLHSIVEGYRRGTANGIRVNPESGLVFSPAHFTWMDTNYPAGTPREGYPIEIQALWFAALEFLGFDDEAQKVRRSIETLYFARDPRHASDCLHTSPGGSAAQAVPDDHNRPNQLLAVTLGAVRDPAKQRAILDDAALLLVPGAIRTLDDVPVSYLLAIRLNGELLNDPARPYRGRYEGSEDRSRKVAYHNGTAWCWPFPAYCEALRMVGGPAAAARARALLESMIDYYEDGVPGELPEVADGDAPHQLGGCPAQAWSITEFYRVHKLLAD